MKKLIFDILQSININAYHNECNNPNEDFYVIYTYYRNSTEIIDNKSRAMIYNVTLTLWYKKDDLYADEKVDKIIEVMKNNKFNYIDDLDIVGISKFGKEIKFKKKNWR